MVHEKYFRRNFSLSLVAALICIGVPAIAFLVGWQGDVGWPFSSSSSTEGQATHWEVYRNEMYGYSVEYPRGWRVEDRSDSVYFTAPGKPLSWGASDVSVVVLEKSGFAEVPLEEYVTQYAGRETGPERVPKQIERVQTKANIIGYRVEWEPSSWSAGKTTYTTFLAYPNDPNATIQIETIEGRSLDVYDEIIATFSWSP